jgi:hypothetical protein
MKMEKMTFNSFVVERRKMEKNEDFILKSFIFFHFTLPYFPACWSVSSVITEEEENMIVESNFNRFKVVEKNIFFFQKNLSLERNFHF